jgi:hypothetical protein
MNVSPLTQASLHAYPGHSVDWLVLRNELWVGTALLSEILQKLAAIVNREILVRPLWLPISPRARMEHGSRVELDYADLQSAASPLWLTVHATTRTTTDGWQDPDRQPGRVETPQLANVATQRPSSCMAISMQRATAARYPLSKTGSLNGRRVSRCLVSAAAVPGPTATSLNGASGAAPTVFTRSASSGYCSR